MPLTRIVGGALVKEIVNSGLSRYAISELKDEWQASLGISLHKINSKNDSERPN